LPQFPIVDKAPWVRRHIPKHIESALHILEAVADAVTAEAGRGGAEPNGASGGVKIVKIGRFENRCRRE
jgi:hypothetical protein